MRTFSKLLLLAVLLNVIRYVLGFPIEAFLIFDGMAESMLSSSAYFKNDFLASDWAASYFYNFMMWFVCVWLFHIARPDLRGSDLLKSVRLFGILFLFFASVSAIYMNHYSHPKEFYYYSIADGLIVFAIVGAANGILYKYFFKNKI
ncbi:hypothetical protein JNM05_03440 [bacterium]|nr:hypothetical protein [bacterium]